ncbi:EOGT [Cordylochernes scorpioides]|uniref:EOGT n=1 Tax=Cordylochernes scorpioides TaxID=51811 RepID=A0ABY6KZQ2_9ARAC|nr:EOGT [Cordylochernes scorpioides]
MDESPIKDHLPERPSIARFSGLWFLHGRLVARTKDQQVQQFFEQGDFGYVKARRQELKTICAPSSPMDSHLECSAYTRFCRGQNIMMDFSSLLTIPQPMKYREDVIKEGQIGGRCQLNKKLLKSMGQHKSPLQSWYAELEHFTELPTEPIKSGKCDVVIDKPTFLMKLDAPVSMYHHFCDFLNLYLTLHLNNTFTRDVSILMWDTNSYLSNFQITWQAFTKNPLLYLGPYKGKKVCFKDVVFPLLPRMIFGLYYNMPLIPGCHSSGLIHAFSRHILHNLNIHRTYQGTKIQVTLISRKTSFRKILNEDEVTHNTDILVGMHGAGLTHMLFLPDWGSVFEIYHCDDRNCYSDLARLRGVQYITWEKEDKVHPQDEGHHPSLGAHAKFTNYRFDVKEFLRLLNQAVEYVQSHHRYQQSIHYIPHDEL